MGANIARPVTGDHQAGELIPRAVAIALQRRWSLAISASVRCSRTRPAFGRRREGLGPWSLRNLALLLRTDHSLK